MKYIFGLLLLSLSASFSFSQETYNPTPQTWTVNFETVPCGETGEKSCLLVKFPGKKEFEIYSDNIEGFTFEKGNTYLISVKQELKQPPIAANESMFKYVLVKIISKKPIAPVTPIAETPVANTSSKIIFDVNFETVPCETNNNGCFLIKERGKKEYEIFQGTIAGFDYQPGYNYTIEVKPTINGNYYLVSELNKKFVKSLSTTNNTSIANNNTNRKIIQPTNIQTSSSLDGKWYLRKMKEAEGSSFVMDENTMWISISTFKDRLDGYGACNKFSAVVKSDLSTSFEVSKLTTDFSNCGNKKIEDLFYDLLQQADRFEVRNGNLILSKQWKYLLAFTSNPNNKEEIQTTYVPQAIVKSDNSKYATDAPIKNEIVYTNTTPTSPVNTSSYTTSSSTSSTTTTTTTSPEIEAKVREIEELKKQLAAQKLQEEIKKQDQLKEQQDAELAALKKQLDDKKKAEDEKVKAQAEIEKQKLDEAKKKATITSTPPNQDIKKQSETFIVKSNENTSPSFINVQPLTEPTKPIDNSEYPNPNNKDIVYYRDGNKLIQTETDNAIFRGNEKNVTLELNTEESKIQFTKGKIPNLIIKTNGMKPTSEYISLYTADIKKGKRIIFVRPYKNKVLTAYSEIAPNTFEIILPENLGEGEYIFVLQNNLNIPIIFNSTATNVYCFGVGYN